MGTRKYTNPRNYCLVLLIALSIACSQNALTTEYKTLGTVEATIATGMNIYFDLVNQDKVTVAQQQQVKKAYDAYYGSLQAAHAAVAAYKTGTSTGDPTVAIDTAVAAGNAILPILRGLGVKI